MTYATADYGNLTLCTLLFDNGALMTGRATRAMDDVARTQAYNDAIAQVRFAFQWALAENRAWVEAQATEAGMLAVFGKTGGE